MRGGRSRAVTIEDVLFFHYDIITLDGGAAGIRDLGALEAALARPHAGFAGEERFPTRFAKAAALMGSIIQRHPFVDGNKRTGLKSGVFFLFLITDPSIMRGHRLETHPPVA